MTRAEAEEYVRSCGEQDGPSSYGHAAEIFAALYDRAPDADDGGQGEIWSLCCAAVAPAPRYASIASGHHGCPGGYDVEVLQISDTEALVAWTQMPIGSGSVGIVRCSLEGRTVDDLCREAACLALADWGQIEWSHEDGGDYDELADLWDEARVKH